MKFKTNFADIEIGDRGSDIDRKRFTVVAKVQGADEAIALATEYGYGMELETWIQDEEAWNIWDKIEDPETANWIAVKFGGRNETPMLLPFDAALTQVFKRS